MSLKSQKQSKQSGQNPPVPPASNAPAEPLAPLFRKLDWVTAAITFAVMLVVYFATLAPELTLEDSGELVTGSFYAGIPHPPGYPVWTIYSWLWTALVPWGNMAWRVALGQATAVAFGCGLLSLMVSRGSSMLMEGIEDLKKMTGNWESAICMVSGVVAGLLVGLDGFMWSESVVVNRISIFGVPWVMIVMVCLMRWIYAPHQFRYLYLAMFCFGICATIHQSLVLAAMGIEIGIIAAHPRLGRDMLAGNSILFILGLVGQATRTFTALDNAGPVVLTIYWIVGIGSIVGCLWLVITSNGLGTYWKAVLIMGFLWFLGAAFYFYMPVSGMTNPPMQWGYPRTVEGFFHALSRGQYEKISPTDIFSDPNRFLSQMGMLVGSIIEEFNLVYACLALLPFFFIFRMQKRERAWMMTLISVYFCIGVLLMIFLNPSPDRSSADLVRVFFASSHTLVAIMVGYGLALTAAYMATNYQKFRFWGFVGGAIMAVFAFYYLINTAAELCFGRYGIPLLDLPGWAIKEAPHWIAQAFAKDQYGLPVFAGLILLGMSFIFIVALALYRNRAPLVITLGLFVLMPLHPALSHWFNSEQRGHMFGYWFGHDMFTPPFKGADGKPLYPEMTKDAVLFGGTDPGRFCPTYMIFCESFTPHKCQPAEDQKFDRRDVYIITQNALADATYLCYIRAHYNRSKQIDPYFFSELVRPEKEKAEGYRTNILSKLLLPVDKFFTENGERIEKRRRTSTSLFVESDFTNLSEFVAKLRGPNQDPLSKWLFDNLSKETQTMITGKADDAALRKALALDLNLLLDRELDAKREIAKKTAEKNELEFGKMSKSDEAKVQELDKELASLAKVEPFYSPSRFEMVKLSPYVKKFIEENPQSFTRIRLNRLLLEEAYPTQIAKSIGGVYPDREIYIPTPKDSEQCFSEYMADAQRRMQHDQLYPNEPRQIKPGEDVHVVGERVQVSGQVAVMSINGLLTKVIFDHNPENEFFVEESFPLDWMYPYLTPYGVIMKINRQPMNDLSEDVLNRDHAFWKEYSKRLMGDVVDYDTKVETVAKWIEKTYLHHNFEGFTGDRAFVRDDDAQKAFSKLRSSIGGIYAWRLNPQTPAQYRPKNEAEAQRLFKEANFTFLQAFAMCPYSPEAVFRYINLLLPAGRLDDALIVAKTCAKLDPYNAQVRDVIERLEGFKGSQPH